ncbi:hypothetical protein [Sulfobacillus thermosulfidooxidans]|uniref:hypothetical protein n=1 Tax=Sulfobacillus thermosulfidooxidans TaxID=28034 RepID=UPI0006B56425|nr:hypothetical protein [Sulfobacillus thermosulfidooxidans]
MAALRWALFTKKLFRSERTIWREIRAANPVLIKLLHALKFPSHLIIHEALNELWTQTEGWGKPSTVPQKTRQLFRA